MVIRADKPFNRINAVLFGIVVSLIVLAPVRAQVQKAPDVTDEKMPPLVYSPWGKFCGKGTDPNAKQVCIIGRDARTEDGQPVAAIAVIEPEGEPKNLLRVTLPS